MLKYIRQWVFKIVTHSTTTQKIKLFHTAEGFLSLENCPLCPHQNLNLTLRLTTILISITIDSLFTWASTSYSGNYISTLLYLTLFAELRHSHVLVWVSVFSSFYSWVALISATYWYDNHIIMWIYQHFIVVVVVLVTQSCPTLCNPMDYTQLASMEFSRQEYWSGQPSPSPGDLPDPGIKPGSPALQANSLPSEPAIDSPVGRHLGRFWFGAVFGEHVHFCWM